MKIILTFISLFIAVLSFGQQLPQFTQWSANQYASNPALSGYKECLEINTGYRMQWAGLDKAPQTGILTVNSNTSTKRKQYYSLYHGVGAKVMRDVFGGFTNFDVSVSYAMHIPLGDINKLSFGTGIGFQQLAFDQANSTTINPDLAVATNATNFLAPTISFGSWFTGKKYYVGATLEQIAARQWRDVGFSSKYNLHGNINAGFIIRTNKGISFLPATIIRFASRARMTADFNCLVDFYNDFSVGLGYRTGDALLFLTRFRAEHFTFGYSFDFTTSSIKGGNFMTHEIMFTFNTERRKISSKDECPLFD